MGLEILDEVQELG